MTVTASEGWPRPYPDAIALATASVLANERAHDLVVKLNEYETIHREHGIEVCVDGGHDVWEDVILDHPAYDSAATDKAEAAGDISVHDGEFVTTSGRVVTGPNYGDDHPEWTLL